MKKVMVSCVAILLTLTACSALAISQSELEANKKVVTELYNEIINHKNFAAASTYLGKKYIQHNPAAADGVEGLKAYIQYLRDYFPSAHTDIKRIFAEGDYVILHVHTTLQPGTRGLAIMDIFKLDQGKVVEHWDVTQEVPENPANPNGMF